MCPALSETPPRLGEGMQKKRAAFGNAERYARAAGNAEQRDVAVVENVFLALESIFPRLARRRHAAEFGEIVVGNDFGFDEAFFEIRMDHAGGLRSFPPFLDRPGANFFFPRGEVSHQPEESVGTLDERGYAGVVDPEILQKLLRFLWRKVDQLGLDLRADRHVSRVVMSADVFSNLFHERIFLGGRKIAFGDIAGEKHGLRGEQLEEFH